MALCISGLCARNCINTYAIVNDYSAAFSRFHVSVSHFFGCNKNDFYESETFLENYESESENFFDPSKTYEGAI
jgi:hypothetical protein